MKKIAMILLLTGFGAIIALNTGCEDEPVEECIQDLVCNDTMEVTACCTDGEDCYFTYNGVDYPDTPEGMINLLDAMDCDLTKSNVGDDYLILQLESLLKEAKELSRH